MTPEQIADRCIDACYSDWSNAHQEIAKAIREATRLALESAAKVANNFGGVGHDVAAAIRALADDRGAG